MFDAIPMFIVSVIFNIYYPYTIIIREDQSVVMRLENRVMRGDYDSVLEWHVPGKFPRVDLA